MAVSGAPDGTYDLYQGDAQHLTALGETPWTESSAALSPDRGQIVFSSNRYGSYDLLVMDLDASGDRVGTRRLTDGPGDELTPVWSPDGTSIAYADRGNGSSTIDLIEADGGTPTVLTGRGGYATTPA